ncbi:alpha-ribazole phosphatase [Azospirillum fermentarium]|uniref:histidine phosphatase family protein n=1 Tax=Azospirillum fermentarium TaxID=1233114 RepID=UPI002227120C|nr:histidine phosphatase family protein [Azospirillum fermentarium]MCW2245208.1 alpha-ribazole phosphatase [Azospirillum fermentarium]
MSVTRWWLIRHAPVINPARTLYGQGEVPADLSDTASLAAVRGVLPAGARWLTTPLSRTRGTAAALGVTDTLAEPDLMEQDFGAWQGLTWDAIAAAHPTAAALFWDDPAAAVPPGGESFDTLARRVEAALLRHSRPADGAADDVVAVIHAGPIRAAVAAALGIPAARALPVRVDPLSLTRLDRVAVPGGDAVWRLCGVNLPPGAALTPP